MSDRAAKNSLFDAFAEVAKALASGRRAEIVDVLAQGERSVDEIASEIDQSVANTSQHLQVLARAGLVRSRMRCEDFAGALEATEQWRRFLPAERLPINVAVLEVLDGREPTNIPALLPTVAACAGHDDYYGFFAGVLFAHAGRATHARNP